MRHQSEQEALDSFSRLKLWKNFSDISKARKWFMAKVAAMGALQQDREEHAAAMARLKEVMRQQEADARAEIDDLEAMVEETGAAYRLAIKSSTGSRRLAVDGPERVAALALRVAAARSRIVASARFLTRTFLQSLDQRAAATFAGNIDL